MQNLSELSGRAVEGTDGDGDYVFSWSLSRRKLAVSTAMETLHSNVPTDYHIFAAGYGHERDTDFLKARRPSLSPAAHHRCGSRGCVPRICPHFGATLLVWRLLRAHLCRT